MRIVRIILKNKKDMRRQTVYFAALGFIIVSSILASCKRKDTFAYTHNYRIDSISIHRIEIGDTTNNDSVLYLFDANLSDCNIEINDELSGRYSHDLGSIDSICSIGFFRENEEFKDSSINVYKRYNNIKLKHIFLKENASVDREADINSSYNVESLTDMIELLNDGYGCSSFGLNDSLKHFYAIFSVDKRHALPDSMSLRFENRNLSARINNHTIKKYFVSRIRDAIYGEEIKY